MYKLSEIRSGHSCIVSWLFGSIADSLRSFLSIREGSRLDVTYNAGGGYVIVSSGGKSYAMSPDAAGAVRVSLSS